MILCRGTAYLASRWYLGKLIKIPWLYGVVVHPPGCHDYVILYMFVCVVWADVHSVRMSMCVV